MRLLAAVLIAGCWLPAQPRDTGPSGAPINSGARRAPIALYASIQNGSHDWAGLTVYGSDDAELAPPAAGENRVVFIGDSLTADWGGDSAKFFPGQPYINRGIEDQSTAQMLLRFRQDVVDLQPKVVVIQGGFNDLIGRNGPGTDGTVADNVLSMVDIAKAHDIRVVIASLTPPCDTGRNPKARLLVGRIGETNERLQEIAKLTGSIYLNCYSALVNPMNGEMKQELTTNGLVPNAAGYALLAPLTEKAIADAIAKH